MRRFFIRTSGNQQKPKSFPSIKSHIKGGKTSRPNEKSNNIHSIVLLSDAFNKRINGERVTVLTIKECASDVSGVKICMKQSKMT